MIITIGQFIAVVCVCLFVGFIIGMVAWYCFGHPRCKHSWEEIQTVRYVDYTTGHATGYKRVYMCTKCGKVKNIEV